MSFQEPLNTNNTSGYEIRISIDEPAFIVLPIPKKESSAYIYLQIDILISNHSSATSYPVINNALVPELLISNQILRPEISTVSKAISASYEGISVPPGQSLIRTLFAKLFWQNNSLVLQGTSSDYQYHHLLTTLNHPNYFWFFNQLLSKHYSLRAIYELPEEDFLLYDSHTTMTIPISRSDFASIFASWTDFHLLESPETNKDVLQIDGIEFEALLLQRQISSPTMQSETSIPFELGMRITNNTSEALRFTSFDSLVPDLCGEEEAIPRHSISASLGWITPTESNFYLLQPNETLTFLMSAHFLRQADESLSLIVKGEGRTRWAFNNLDEQRYQVQLTYRAPTVQSDALFDDLWIGRVTAPSKELCLVEI